MQQVTKKRVVSLADVLTEGIFFVITVPTKCQELKTLV